MDTQKKETEASLSGHLYYSRKQFKKARDLGRDRTFARLVDGTLIEYTELVSWEQLMEESGSVCLEPDGHFLGSGTFDHFADERGRKYK